LKTSHETEITQLKSNVSKQSESASNQKPKGLDIMKQALAKEFENRIKK